MYSRQEASRLKQEFWTAFGLYMQPVPSEDGEKINWVNYKTGEKHIVFRMQATNNRALIAFEINHKDAGMRALYFEQLLQLKNIFLAAANGNWNWQQEFTEDEGRTVSRVYQELDGFSIYNKQDWPQLISFFKQGIMALDRFWSQVRYSFEALR